MTNRSVSAAEVAAKTKANRIPGGWLVQCPAQGHDDKTPSCKVWDGDDGAVRFHCFAGCDWRDVRHGAEALGWLPEWSGDRRDPISDERRRELEKARLARERKEAQGRERKRRWARRIWSATVPITRTPAARYLESRGLRGPYPETLRYLARCPHPNVSSTRRFPAMVTAVSSLAPARGCAVHLTFLAPDGSGKAALDCPRVIIGPANGGAVHLGTPRGALAIAEGIETALSVQQSTGIPTWSALNTSLMRNMELPPVEQVPKLYVAADGDVAGLKAAHALATRARSEGRTVHVVPAPDGLDWNDLLRGAA